jgi:hypothetical protein
MNFRYALNRLYDIIPNAEEDNQGVFFSCCYSKYLKNFSHSLLIYSLRSQQFDQGHLNMYSGKFSLVLSRYHA